MGGARALARRAGDGVRPEEGRAHQAREQAHGRPPHRGRALGRGRRAGEGGRPEEPRARARSWRRAPGRRRRARAAEGRGLREKIRAAKGQKQQRAIKRLKVGSAFITSENKPEWMILEAVPVIPPELRTLVQLDGGRFATRDAKDL